MTTGARLFMLVGATGLVLLLGLPLLIRPMAWGRRLGWTIPEPTDFANYLGRSLGGVALALGIMGYVTAYDPWQYRFMFDLVILIGIFLTGVHAHGFFKKTQPIIEHVEIILYAVGSVLAWYVYPHQPR